MSEPTGAPRLLHKAAVFLDRHPDLVVVARRGLWGGFDTGGRWMALALTCHRGRPVQQLSGRFNRAGFLKYGACTVFAAGLAAAVWPIAWLLVPLIFAIAFYALEARLVFVFPAMIDYGPRSGRAAAALVIRAGGVINVMSVVMPLAAVMLGGGFAGRGFLRSWLLGCTAVVLWYEELRSERSPRPPRLDLGGRAPLVVRQESWGSSTSGSCTRVLYASDLHFGAPGTKTLIRELARIVERERPDLVLLGGDLVDGRRGIGDLEAALSNLTSLAPVAAVSGNHDRLAGLDRVRAAVQRSGVAWLEDKPYETRSIIVDGTPRRGPRDGRRRLLCAHNPAVFPEAVSLGYDLVFAGHLHGGQVVAFEWAGRLYPGAWLYRWNGVNFVNGRTRMLVSRGAADTIPLRWRCPREVIVCLIDPPPRPGTKGPVGGTEKTIGPWSVESLG